MKLKSNLRLGYVVVPVLLLGAMGFVKVLNQVGVGGGDSDAAPRMGLLITHVGGDTGPLAPLRSIEDLDTAKVSLGKRLFHDARLSGDGTISCASCHDLGSGGDDGFPLSVGIGGKIGDRNAPTVFNSAFNPFQFWDGREDSLEGQVDGPIENPKEMGSSWAHVIEVVSGDQQYLENFNAIYGEAPTPDNVRGAIAEFERSLVTLDSPFDRYLQGDVEALSAEALRCYHAFIEVGCVTCHQGVNVGGIMLQPLGLMSAYSEMGGDQGSKPSVGLQVFRVPSLRNVALTDPYLHDGSIEKLEDGVRLMAQYQLGEDLEDAVVFDLVSFLESLTGAGLEGGDSR